MKATHRITCIVGYGISCSSPHRFATDAEAVEQAKRLIESDEDCHTVIVTKYRVDENGELVKDGHWLKSDEIFRLTDERRKPDKLEAGEYVPRLKDTDISEPIPIQACI